MQLVDYAFGGIDQELPAGVTVFRVENLGTEVHELVLIGIKDGVPATLDELIALPEEESAALINFVGVAFAYPGTSGSLVADLTPGRYVAICFLPTGATPELMSQAPEGPPDPSVSLPAEVAALLRAPRTSRMAWSRSSPSSTADGHRPRRCGMRRRSPRIASPTARRA